MAALPVSGDGNLQLTATGSVLADAAAEADRQRPAERDKYGETAGGAGDAQRGGHQHPAPFSAGDNDALTFPSLSPTRERACSLRETCCH